VHCQRISGGLPGFTPAFSSLQAFCTITRGDAPSLDLMTQPVRKLRWGILSTAKIARVKVIPAIQTSRTAR
jgi:hypothetical protein